MLGWPWQVKKNLHAAQSPIASCIFFFSFFFFFFWRSTVFSFPHPFTREEGTWQLSLAGTSLQEKRDRQKLVRKTMDIIEGKEVRPGD